MLETLREYANELLARVWRPVGNADGTRSSYP